MGLKSSLTIALGVVMALVGGTVSASAKERFAVIVANKDYRHTADVDFALRDADAIETMLKNVMDVPERNIQRIENATLGDLRALFGSGDRMGRIGNLVRGADSELFVYFAGHGSKELVDQSGTTEPFIMGVDTRPEDLAFTGYKLDDMVSQLRRLREETLPNGRVTLVLESCFSGRSHAGEFVQNASAPLHGAPIVVTERLPDADENFLVFAAAQGDEYAVWDTEHQQSLFTDALVSAYYGEADEANFGGDADGQVTLAELKRFVDERVNTRLQALKPGARQAPDMAGGDPNLKLASTGDIMALSPTIIRRRHSERLLSASLMAREDASATRDYLRTCIYCPREDELRKMMRANYRKAQICTIERDEVARLMESGTAREIELFQGESQCSDHADKLIARLAALNGTSTPVADGVETVSDADPIADTDATVLALAATDATADEEALADDEGPLEVLTGVALKRALQTELARVGCLRGRVDGVWGRQSRRALASFVKAVDDAEGVDRRNPTMDALAIAQSVEGELCEAPAAVTRTSTRSTRKATTRKATRRKTTTRKSRNRKATTRKSTRRKATTQKRTTRSGSSAKTRKQTSKRGPGHWSCDPSLWSRKRSFKPSYC